MLGFISFFQDLDNENERKIQLLLQDKFELGRKLVSLKTGFSCWGRGWGVVSL